jgi:hypothetical protein
MMVQAPRPKAISALVLSTSSTTPRTGFSPKNTTTTGSPFCNAISPEGNAHRRFKQKLRRAAVQFGTLSPLASPSWPLLYQRSIAKPMESIAQAFVSLRCQNDVLGPVEGWRSRVAGNRHLYCAYRTDGIWIATIFGLVDGTIE